MLELHAALDAALERAPARGPVVLAYSGGSDSTALLHVLAHCDEARTRGLRALHVDHGLAAASGDWSRRCAEACAALGVPLEVLPVVVAPGSEGLEAAARRARYDALGAALQPGELLLTAHHADDQAETTLLRWLRGAGVNGLAGMREWRELPAGWLGRPWLTVPRAKIDAWIRAAGLPFVMDPANADIAHDRNYLRMEIFPRLAARWPHATAAIAQGARLVDGAARALARRNHMLLDSLQDADGLALDCSRLRELDTFDLGEVVRAWIAQSGAPPPPSRVLDLLRTELLEIREDATPMLAWRGFALRRFRDALYLTAPQTPLPCNWQTLWNAMDPLELPGGLGILHAGATAPLPLKVAFRRGGERMRLGAEASNRPVRLLLQELGVPTWERDRIPLLSDAVGVAAIGDTLVAQRLRDALAAAGARLQWQPQPR